MSEAYRAAAHALEREHPGVAGLLRELHRETAEDRRDLIWTLAQVAGIVIDTRSREEIAA
jgi:hypothetical protein